MEARKKSAVWSFDCAPVTFEPSHFVDYNGYQLNRFVFADLAYLERKSLISISPSPAYIDIEILRDFRWPDGKSLLIDEIEAGIRRVFERNPLIKKLFVPEEMAFQRSQDRRSTRLMGSNAVMKLMLKSSLFVPYRSQTDQYLSKAQSVENISSGGFEIHRHERNDFIEVRYIKEPEDNLRLFMEGKIDRSSDTSFPLNALSGMAAHPGFRFERSGLFGAFTFGRNLAHPQAAVLRQQIAQLIANLDFSDIHHNAYFRNPSYCSQFPTDTGSFPLALFPYRAIDLSPYSGTVLEVAYDDYYPNRELCQKVCDLLNAFGLRAECSKRDFYSPTNDWDIKFSISFSFCDHPFFNYAQLIGLPVIYQNDDLRNLYFRIIRTYVKSGDLAEGIYQLDAFLKDHCPSVPVLEIPSIYMDRGLLSHEDSLGC